MMESANSVDNGGTTTLDTPPDAPHAANANANANSPASSSSSSPKSFSHSSVAFPSDGSDLDLDDEIESSISSSWEDLDAEAQEASSPDKKTGGIVTATTSNPIGHLPLPTVTRVQRTLHSSSWSNMVALVDSSKGWMLSSSVPSKSTATLQHASIDQWLKQIPRIQPGAGAKFFFHTDASPSKDLDASATSSATLSTDRITSFSFGKIKLGASAPIRKSVLSAGTEASSSNLESWAVSSSDEEDAADHATSSKFHTSSSTPSDDLVISRDHYETLTVAAAVDSAAVDGTEQNTASETDLLAIDFSPTLTPAPQPTILKETTASTVDDSQQDKQDLYFVQVSDGTRTTTAIHQGPLIQSEKQQHESAAPLNGTTALSLRPTMSSILSTIISVWSKISEERAAALVPSTFSAYPEPGADEEIDPSLLLFSSLTSTIAEELALAFVPVC
ncbi:hypothetical protein HDU97_009196 [Phlyctochytrium planicorne]|nr:hypothetical protein HDU97_009196 [Phlyctochytrium planicorne]